MAAEKLTGSTSSKRTCVTHRACRIPAYNASVTLADRTTSEEPGLHRQSAQLPDDSSRQHGLVLYRLEITRALAHLQRAYGRDPTEIAAHVGEVLWVRGQQQMARSGATSRTTRQQCCRRRSSATNAESSVRLLTSPASIAIDARNTELAGTGATLPRAVGSWFSHPARPCCAWSCLPVAPRRPAPLSSSSPSS